MTWQDKLKQGNYSIHVIATGAGAGLQQELWSVPGSSAYLSGAAFPYSPEEQQEVLGFLPTHFCSQEAAIDLASAAYLKAYVPGKKAVGVGITATVASLSEHRGDHRVHVCVMTDDKVYAVQETLTKGIGEQQRYGDGKVADQLALCLLRWVLFGTDNSSLTNVKQLATERFFERPFFSAAGKRLESIPDPTHSYPVGGKYISSPYVIMSGAFNPPHQGHFGIAANLLDEYGKVAVFEITAEPPHKEPLSVQQLLQRSKLLQGCDRIFTRKLPFYLDKARAFPGISLALGADAMVRMLDPKWGVDIPQMLEELSQLGTKLYVSGREVDGKFITLEDITISLPDSYVDLFERISLPVHGQWDISSSQLRVKLV